jgi:hypothetical protein
LPPLLSLTLASSLKNFLLFLDKLIRSGENGRYELADMAQSMPTTMTKANVYWYVWPCRRR